MGAPEQGAIRPGKSIILQGTEHRAGETPYCGNADFARRHPLATVTGVSLAGSESDGLGEGFPYCAAVARPVRGVAAPAALHHLYLLSALFLFFLLRRAFFFQALGGLFLLFLLAIHSLAHMQSPASD